MMNTWENLNPRERMLAKITLALLLIIFVVFGSLKAYTKLDNLDERIANLELELLNLHQQEAQRVSVERSFEEVVEEHSSAMTQEEIHDGLRREIYRLALANPELPEEKQPKQSSQKYMVQIPMFREGVLKEEGDGYREYQIRIQIPATRFLNVIAFLRRLEESPFILRVDSFDLTRDPSASDFRITMEITRTVLDNPDAIIEKRDSLRRSEEI